MTSRRSATPPSAEAKSLMMNQFRIDLGFLPQHLPQQINFVTWRRSEGSTCAESEPRYHTVVLSHPTPRHPPLRQWGPSVNFKNLWKPGTSGNPAGRPRGSRNKAVRRMVARTVGPPRWTPLALAAETVGPDPRGTPLWASGAPFSLKLRYFSYVDTRFHDHKS